MAHTPRNAKPPEQTNTYRCNIDNGEYKSRLDYIESVTVRISMETKVITNVTVGIFPCQFV